MSNLSKRLRERADSMEKGGARAPFGLAYATYVDVQLLRDAAAKLDDGVGLMRDDGTVVVRLDLSKVPRKRPTIHPSDLDYE